MKANDEMSFIGTAMVFLVAGICYELAKSPDLQRRMQVEGKLETTTTSRDSPFSTS